MLRGAQLLTMMTLGGRLFALPLTALAQGPDDAHAQAGENADDELDRAQMPKAVRVVVLGTTSQADLVARATSWFESPITVTGDQQTSVPRSELTSAPPEGCVNLWVAVSDDSAAIFAAARRQGTTRYLKRHIETGTDEQSLEATAQAIHYTAMALWEGTLTTQRQVFEDELSTASPALLLPPAPAEHSAGTTAIEPSPAPVEPPPEPSTERLEPPPQPVKPPQEVQPTHVPFAATLGYGFNAGADEAVAHGPQIEVGLPLGRLGTISISGRYLIQDSFDVDSSDVGATTVETTGARLRVEVDLGFDMSHAWELAPKLGLGVNVNSGRSSLGNSSTQARKRTP